MPHTATTRLPQGRRVARAIGRYVLPAVLLTCLALVVRLRAIDAFVSPDEFRWVCRSINFHHGLRTGDLTKTLQTGHPGVLTMWVGVPAMDEDPIAEWHAFCVDANLASSSALHETAEEAPARFASLLFGARRGVAIVTALCVGAAFLLLARLGGLRLALLGGVLLLLDPFFLAHSRVLHLDAIASGLLFLSLLSLAIGLREDHAGYLALSGVCTGLAALNKSPAMFGAPFAAVAIVGAALLDRRSPTWVLRRGLVWGLPAALAFGALWPSMWVQPIATLRLVFSTATGYAGQPHSSDNYFWFAARPDPGVAFYPVALLFRLTSWTTLGSALAIPLAVRRGPHRRTLWLLWGFVLGYIVLMTLGMKKFDRYILPVFPPLQALAAAGLWAGWDGFLRRIARPWVAQHGAPALVGGLLAGGALAILPHAPHYFAYYNPLLGGAHTADDVLLIGRGEGLDLAADYLNHLPNAANAEVVARSMSTFAPLFVGRTVSPYAYDPARTDYIVFYVNEIQRGHMPELLERYYGVVEPLHVVRLHGIDYVYIYANSAHEAPLAWIEEHADPATDAIVVNRPSLLETAYRGPLPVYALPGAEDEDEALRTLQQAADGAIERFWFVDYGERRRNSWFDCWVDHQLGYHADLVEEHAFTDVSLSLWELRNDAFARAADVRRHVGVEIDGELALVSYGLCAPEVEWTRGLHGILEWHALTDVSRDLSVVAYIVGPDGRTWGQGDRWIVSEGQAPTGHWRQDDRVMSEMVADLTPALAPGIYTVELEVYDRATRERVPVRDASGTPLDNPFALGTVTIGPSRCAPDPEHLPVQPHEVWVAPTLKLAGWSVDRSSLYFGDRLAVAMSWQAADSITEDYAVRLQLEDPEGGILAHGVFPVASPEHPTSAWLPGEVLWRYYDLTVAKEATACNASLNLTLLDGDGAAVGEPVTLMPVRIEGRYHALPASAHPQSARLGDTIRLLGFSVDSPTVQPGQTLEVALYWRAEAAIAAQYTVFTHLLGPDGTLLGQEDSMPLDGRYPTDRWQEGEIIGDRYHITVDEEAPPGRYQLGIGMYDWAAGMQSVPIYDEWGERQPDDRLMLDIEITVLDQHMADRP
jgi:4-amino-4-deoxy-L-arabinose transferase-like glycosyltransferase